MVVVSGSLYGTLACAIDCRGGGDAHTVLLREVACGALAIDVCSYCSHVYATRVLGNHSRGSSANASAFDNVSRGRRQPVQVGAPSCGDAAGVRSRSDDIATNREHRLRAGNLVLA